MNIAWFTPFHKTSAIGKIGIQICDTLAARGHEVDVWAYETENTLQTNLPVKHYTPADIDVAELAKYDYVIYNMGNHATFHWAIYEVLAKFPGIVILHDRTMQSFFRINRFGIDESIPFDEVKQYFIEVMRSEYGEDGANLAKNYNESADKPDVALFQSCALPVLYPIVSKATAVFTHTANFARDIEEKYNTPTGFAYLPYRANQAKQANTTPGSYTRKDGKMLIVSNGLVHSVKRLDKICLALVEDQSLRDQIDFVVIGNCDGPFGDRLKTLASKELQGCLHMLGYLSYDEMENILSMADVCINMRYPNSEVCSLSLFEQYALGKPVIAIDSGVYGEMSDDCIVKIPIENEIEGLKEKLHWLIDYPEERTRIGQNAKAFLEKECTYERYASTLEDFLVHVCDQQSKRAEEKAYVEKVRKTMADLHLNRETTPKAFEDLLYGMQKSLCIPRPTYEQKTIALWFAFPYEIKGLHREGISKYMSRLARALMDYTDYNLEVWSYSLNQEEMEIIFSDELLSEDPAVARRILLVNENNFREALNIPLYLRAVERDISPEKDNLAVLASEYSKADIFIPAIIYLDNVIGTNRKLVVPAHDMAVKYHYEDFTWKQRSYVYLSRNIDSAIERLARHGAVMVSLSDAVRKSHILTCIDNVREEDTFFVHVPEIMPNYEGTTFSRERLDAAQVPEEYLFYPTQIRPHKNLETVINALCMLKKRDHREIPLVLTGVLDDVPNVRRAVEECHMEDQLIFLKNVDDDMLLQLYHFAAAVPVPTLMEGGFPVQALEAIHLNVPTIVSSIPVVTERIVNAGETPENTTLQIFDPSSAEDMYNKLAYVLSHRDDVVQKQMIFKDKLGKYTWKDAIQKYEEVFVRARQKEIYGQ